MGGADRMDRMISYCRCSVRSNRRTHRTLLNSFYLACINSWLFYWEDITKLGVLSKNILGYRRFKIELAKELITVQAESSDSEGEHHPGMSINVPTIAFRKKRAEHLPEVVASKNANRYRNEGCNGKSRTRRPRNCFVLFHGVQTM